MTAILSTVTTSTDAALMTPDAYAGNVKAVESIGRRTTSLTNDSDSLAAAIIANVPDGYDWAKRGAKPAAVHLFACGAVKGDAVPAQKDENKRVTNYGTGVNTLVAALTRALDTEPEQTVAMRVSLTGVGSAVVPTDHPAYALLLALLGADADESGEPVE